MKRFLLTLLVFALVVALIALALMPVAFRQYRLWENAEVVSGYREAVARLDPEDSEELLSLAQAYNEAMNDTRWTDPDAAESARADGEGGYAALLNPAGNGVMAVLGLPKLGVTLAVFHGEGGENGNSDPRVCHLPGSGLPTGRAEGPCVLYAVRDRFFDPLAGLERLIVGDCFYIYGLDGALTYEVFQVGAATPRDPEDLQGDGDGDECVLVAAASGAGDEQRLVVRGRRVTRQSVKPVDDSRALPSGVAELIFGMPVAVAGLFLLMVTEWLRRTARRRMRRHMKL